MVSLRILIGELYLKIVVLTSDEARRELTFPLLEPQLQWSLFIKCLSNFVLKSGWAAWYILGSLPHLPLFKDKYCCPFASYRGSHPSSKSLQILAAFPRFPQVVPSEPGFDGRWKPKRVEVSPTKCYASLNLLVFKVLPCSALYLPS